MRNTTRKKSIDLEFMVWQRLALPAQRRGKTLSETIVQLTEDAEHKEKYATQMTTLKQDLQALLGKKYPKGVVTRPERNPATRVFIRRKLKPAAERTTSLTP